MTWGPHTQCGAVRSRSRSPGVCRCGLVQEFLVEGQPCWALVSSSVNRGGGSAWAACREVRGKVTRGGGWGLGSLSAWNTGPLGR